MLFLIDENLPRTLGDVFQEKGFKVEIVQDNPELRGEPDEVIFDYAARRQAIIVTRDLGVYKSQPIFFESYFRFDRYQISKRDFYWQYVSRTRTVTFRFYRE